MKILTVTTSFPRFIGDVPGRFVLDLASAIAKEGHEITVVCPSYGAERGGWVSGVKVVRFGRSLPKFLKMTPYSSMLFQVRHGAAAKIRMLFLFLSQIISCVAEAREDSADLLHSHWLVPSGLSAAIASTLLGIPHILTVHGAGLAGLEGTLPGRMILNLVCARSDLLCTVSKDQQRRLNRIVDPVISGRIKCVPMGVPVGRFSCGRQEASEGNILFVGRLTEKKGLIHLLRALSNLKDRGSPHCLEICGTGPLEKELRNMANDMGISDYTWFRGYVDERGLDDCYSRAQLVVIPSTMGEGRDVDGVPLVLLESMYLGKPIVSTRVGGIPDIIEDGKTGTLVAERSPEELREGIQTMLKNRRYALTVGLRASKISRERYTTTSVGRRYLALMWELNTRKQMNEEEATRSPRKDSLARIKTSRSLCRYSQKS